MLPTDVERKTRMAISYLSQNLGVKLCLKFSQCFSVFSQALKPKARWHSIDCPMNVFVKPYSFTFQFWFLSHVAESSKDIDNIRIITI